MKDEAYVREQELAEEAGRLYIVEVGYDHSKDTYCQTRAEALAKAEEETRNPENNGQRVRIEVWHNWLDLGRDKEYIIVRDWERPKEELARELAQIINDAEVKSDRDYEELCELAGLGNEWKKAVGEDARTVLAKAADTLGVKIHWEWA